MYALNMSNITSKLSIDTIVSFRITFHTQYMGIPEFMKSGGLRLLESSGHIQACNGIVLPLTRVYDLSCYYTLLWQAQLVAGIPPRRPGFYPREVHLR
jgi:hypothetical protein